MIGSMPRSGLWDARTGSHLLSFPCSPGLVFDIAISPTGRWLAAGVDHCIKLWAVETGREVRSITVIPDALSGSSLRNSVRGLCFSPDESRIASASQRPQADAPGSPRARWRQVISEWDLATGREVRTTVGNFPISRNLVISPSGDRMAYARDSYNVGLLATTADLPPREFRRTTGS